MLLLPAWELATVYRVPHRASGDIEGTLGCLAQGQIASLAVFVLRLLENGSVEAALRLAGTQLPVGTIEREEAGYRSVGIASNCCLSSPTQ